MSDDAKKRLAAEHIRVFDSFFMSDRERWFWRIAAAAVWVLIGFVAGRLF